MIRLRRLLFVVLACCLALNAAAQRPNFNGVYLGTLPASPGAGSVADGRFALYVYGDRAAFFIAYVQLRAFLGDLPAGGYVTHTRCYVARGFMLNDGAFAVDAEYYLPTAALRGGTGTPPSPHPIILSSAFVRGTISGNSLTGQLEPGGAFATVRSPDEGPFGNLSGSGVYVAHVVNGDGIAYAVIDPA
jgi:hypothetical protein